jgi:non-homologous end joining protein Ku
MPIDRYVRALVVERMSRKDAVNLVRRSSGPDVAKLRAEREAINNEMISLAQQWVNMGMTPMQFKTANDKYKERLEHVEWQLMEATRQSVLGPLVGAANVAAVFDNMVLEQQRAVINELMQVTILRNKGHRGFRPESIQIDWRTPSQ